MRILFLGDVVGRPGRRACQKLIKELRSERSLDFVIANGENAAGGSGLTRDTAAELFDAGVDVITSGNHIWSKREIFEVLDQEERILRPLNYPPGSPGTGARVYDAPGGVKVGVINASGRVFMEPLDSPFAAVEAALASQMQRAHVIFVDFHAEATSEKVAMGWYLDGRVTAVVGTHTHVQTADERVLPGGTAYITDLGMTGPLDSVLGVDKEIILRKFLTSLPERFEVAGGPVALSGAIIEADPSTGKARHIERVFKVIS